tara:strand:+ start:14091 stop:14564 length:474 start_codon:yes stop_codon:yes gene_type:complete
MSLTYEQRQAKIRGFLAGITRKLKTVEADLREAGFRFEDIKGARWHGRCDEDGNIFADFLRRGALRSSTDLEQLMPHLEKVGVHVFLTARRIYAAQTAEGLESIRQRVEQDRADTLRLRDIREQEQLERAAAEDVLDRVHVLLAKVGIDELERLVGK